MNRRDQILLGGYVLFAILSVIAAFMLLNWSLTAFSWMNPENFERPFRGPFRLVFSGFVVVLLSSIHVALFRRIARLS